MQKSFVLSLLSILAIAQQANGISVQEFKRNNKNVAANFYDSAGVTPGSVGKCNLEIDFIICTSSNISCAKRQLHESIRNPFDSCIL